jgi:hypothetical protein
MWVKIKASEPEINSAILNAYRLLIYFKENNLEKKSVGAQQKSLSRKLANLRKQVI